MNCRKVSHLLSAYMDGELPGVEHRQIYEHLARCTECWAEYKGLLHTKRLLAALRVQNPRPELPALVLQRLAAEESWSAGRLPADWFQQIRQWVKQAVPLPHGLAIGAGLAMVSFLYIAHTPNPPDQIQWYPASAAHPTALMESASSAPNFDVFMGPAPTPVGNVRVWRNPLPQVPMVTPVTNETLFPAQALEAPPIPWRWSHRP